MLGERFGWSQREDKPDELLNASFDFAIENFPSDFGWLERYRFDCSVTKVGQISYFEKILGETAMVNSIVFLIMSPHFYHAAWGFTWCSEWCGTEQRSKFLLSSWSCPSWEMCLRCWIQSEILLQKLQILCIIACKMFSSGDSRMHTSFAVYWFISLLRLWAQRVNGMQRNRGSSGREWSPVEISASGNTTILSLCVTWLKRLG